ncbi:hypothetical protein A6R68_00418 [Neotoma lepida]|uniref:Uncharacterized protein n=1 Tax=Neotoma lepida TaxID=56216 RepID=A0A1A6GXY7_NEOLE|nr:hypothetical protein A6R68_00418 [Neotoma lepida]
MSCLNDICFPPCYLGALWRNTTSIILERLSTDTPELEASTKDRSTPGDRIPSALLTGLPSCVSKQDLRTLSSL